MTSQSWTAEGIKKVIAARFPYPEFATFFEVANTTGFEKKRFADAIAVSMWESRGLSITGFEIKVSRRDLIQELRSPEKMDPFFEHINQWFLVTPAGLVADREHWPAGWGLIEIHGTTAKPVMKRAIAAPSKTVTPLMSRKFFTVLMRHAYDKRPESRLLREAFEEGYNQATERNKHDLEQRKRREEGELERLREKCHNFTDKTGLNVNDRYGWPSRDVVRAWEKFDDAASALDMIQSNIKRLTSAAEEGLSLFTKAKQAAGMKPEDEGET